MLPESALGQEAANFDIRIDARFQLAKQLRDEPVAIDDGRIALLGARNKAGGPPARASNCTNAEVRCARMTPYAHRKRFFARHGAKQRIANRLIDQRIVAKPSLPRSPR